MAKSNASPIDDDFDVKSVLSSESFRRPLREGERLPEIPSMVEQALLAGAASTRPTKRASN